MDLHQSDGAELVPLSAGPIAVAEAHTLEARRIGAGPDVAVLSRIRRFFLTGQLAEPKALGNLKGQAVTQADLPTDLPHPYPRVPDIAMQTATSIGNDDGLTLPGRMPSGASEDT